MLGLLATFAAVSLTLLPQLVAQSHVSATREILDDQLQNTLTDLRVAVEYDPAARQAILANGPTTFTVMQPTVQGTPEPISIAIVPSATTISISANAGGESESIVAVVDPEAPAPQSTLLAPAISMP